MGINDKAWHVGFKWTIGDPDNNTGAICLDEGSDALHICEIKDAATNWAVSTTSHPTLYIHSATDPATDYVRIYHDGTSGIIDCDGTTILAMTALTLAVTADVTVTGDVDLGTEDISVATGKYIYLDGGVDDYLRAPTDNNVLLNGRTTVSLGVFGTTEVAVDSSAVTLATNNLTLTAGNISVAVGKYVYLDGQGGGDYLRAYTDNNVILNGATTVSLGVNATTELEVSSSDVTLATNNLVLTTGSIKVATTKYIYLDGGTDDYLRAYTDNNVLLNGKSTVALGVNGTTELEVGATDVTLATNNLVLTAGDIKVATTKYIYFDGGTDDYIRCYSDNNLLVSGKTTSILGVSGASVITAAAAAVTIAQATTITAALTVGSSGVGYDVTLNADTANYRILWDAEGDSNKGSLEIGQNTYGIDFSLYGQTSGDSLVWDASSSLLTITSASLAADDRITKFMGTQATPGMADGVGAVEIDLTVTGQATGYISASSTWVNLTSGTLKVSNTDCITPRNDGVYAAGASELANGAIFYGGRFQAVLPASDYAILTMFSANVSQAQTAIFHVNSQPNFGLVAGVHTGAVSGSVPFMCDIAGGSIKYIRVYDSAS